MNQEISNFGKKKYIRLRNDQERKIEVIQMILCEELIEKYMEMDKLKYDSNERADHRSKKVLPLAVIMRLGVDRMIEEMKADIKERDRQDMVE